MSRFLLFLAVALACNANVDARPRQPNIVLIVAEDMGCDLGCYGCPFLQTPHIDQFATEGVLFENAYTTQASCSPSRSSIFTGLYPHENGQVGLKKRGGNACDYMMHRGIPKLPELLRKHGYHTVLMGKIDVAPEEELAFDQRLWKWDTNPYYYDRVVAEFLDEAPQQPFFLMVNLKDAHKVPVPGASGKSDYIFPRGYDGARLAKQDVQLPSWYAAMTLVGRAQYRSCASKSAGGDCHFPSV